MDEAALDGRPHARLDGVDREQADGRPDQVFEIQLATLTA